MSKLVYLAALLMGVLLMSFFTYYSYDWLQSIGSPTDAFANYSYFAGLGWALLFISSGVLLLIANIVLWTSRRSWAMWVTAAYFIVFLSLRAFWLEPSMEQFAAANNLQPTAAAIGPFVTMLLFIAAIAAIFFDNFIVLRMADKIHPPIESAIETPEPTKTETE